MNRTISLGVDLPTYEMLWETIPEMGAATPGESVVASHPPLFGIPVHVNPFLPDGVRGMMADGKGGFVFLVTEEYERRQLARRFAAKGWRVKIESGR